MKLERLNDMLEKIKKNLSATWNTLKTILIEFAVFLVFVYGLFLLVVAIIQNHK